MISFSLLVNGDFIVTEAMPHATWREIFFQSPSKWRFHCNESFKYVGPVARGAFQSPSKWRFHCNGLSDNKSPLVIDLSVS